MRPGGQKPCSAVMPLSWGFARVSPSVSSGDDGSRRLVSLSAMVPGSALSPIASAPPTVLRLGVYTGTLPSRVEEKGESGPRLPRWRGCGRVD
jgi:hypothetical protein